MTIVRTRIFSSFDDPDCGPEVWAMLLNRGDTDSADLSWQWQRNWWKAFGNDHLLLIGAERGNELVAIALFFTAGGMIFNICPESYLDFVGDVSDNEILDALLEAAMREVTDFHGFRLYFIPDFSRTGERLQKAAARLGLRCMDEDSIPSPILNITSEPNLALAATRKKSLVRHENYFQRECLLEVEHIRKPEAIIPHLDDFFDQHIRRRSVTPNPSLFEDPRQRDYYKQIIEEIGPTGWLRFTRISWKGRPIAFHIGNCYRGRYSYGIPCFEIELASHSPGEVLLRQLLLAAIEERADCFDFGIGNEAYKYRFATCAPLLHTWGLYPTSSPAIDES